MCSGSLGEASAAGDLFSVTPNSSSDRFETKGGMYVASGAGI